MSLARKMMEKYGCVAEMSPETIGAKVARAAIDRDDDLYGHKTLHPSLKAHLVDRTNGQIKNIVLSLQKRDKKKFIQGARDPKSSYQRASKVYVNTMRNLPSNDISPEKSVSERILDAFHKEKVSEGSGGLKNIVRKGAPEARIDRQTTRGTHRKLLKADNLALHALGYRSYDPAWDKDAKRLGIDPNDTNEVNETSMNKLASATAKAIAIKTQERPINIAYVHAGMVNKGGPYPKEKTYHSCVRDGSTPQEKKDATDKRQELQDFLRDRREDKCQIWKNRSKSVRGKYYDANVEKASNLLSRDADAIRVVSDGGQERTVNNSTRYWDYRKMIGADSLKTPNMDSIVAKIS